MPWHVIFFTSKRLPLSAMHKLYIMISMLYVWQAKPIIAIRQILLPSSWGDRVHRLCSCGIHAKYNMKRFIWKPLKCNQIFTLRLSLECFWSKSLIGAWTSWTPEYNILTNKILICHCVYWNIWLMHNVLLVT